MVSEKDFEFTQMEIELLYWTQFYALKTEAETGDNIGFFSSLFKSDVENRKKNEQIKQLKLKWLHEWSNKTKFLLNITETQSIEKIKQELNGHHFSEGKMLAFIVELTTFTPYFNFDKDNVWDDVEFNSGIYLSSMESIIPIYGSKLSKCREIYFDAQNKIAKEVKGSSNIVMWMSVAAVASLLMAPYLGAVIGGIMGLSGAAATSAGLAFLGFGSIATGGLGMAGGSIAIMAGGSLFAYKARNSIYQEKIREQSCEAILISCSKLAAVTSLIKKPKTIIESLCNSARVIQFDFEAEADGFFINKKYEKGNASHEKAKIIGAFRHFLRSLNF